MKPPPTMLDHSNACGVRALKVFGWIFVIGCVGFVVACLIVCNLGSAFESSRINPNKIYIHGEVKTALGLYRIDMFDYPTTAEGWPALMKAPAGNTNVANWRGPYTYGFPIGPPPEPCKQPLQWLSSLVLPVKKSEVPLDSWGHSYRYAYPGTHTWPASTTASAAGTIPVTHYDVWSLGPDGIDGTADDIGNWMQ